MITKDSNGTTLSASYISALTATDREYDAKLLDNGTALNCSIDKITITKGSCGDTNGFTIGSVVGSTLVANVRGLTASVKGKELEVQIGLKVSGSFVYVTMGYFVVSEVSQNAYSTNITAYGATITRTGDAFTVPSTVTLANIASSCSTSISALAGRTVNVTFDTGITTSNTITASLNNLTVYQAIQVLASVCGGYAIDTNDGHIKICRFSDTATLSRDTSTMLNLPMVEEKNFKIAGVLCIVTEASEDDQGQVVPAVQYPSTPTGNENLIVKNQFVTQTLYTNYLATLTNYEYRPATVGLTYGDPRLEGNDVLSVTDINSNVYIIPCHMITHSYTGGFSTQVISVPATPQQNDVASSAGSLTEQLGSISASVISARTSAETAYSYAQQAKQTTDEINDYATLAGKTVTQILDDGETAHGMAQQAQTDATSAKASAQNASEYASRALGNLSTVQSVAETLTWITAHGTMTPTSDVALDPTHVYFTRNDSTGYYTVGAHKYDIVVEPDVDDIATYYVLTIDESLNNYVGTHLALDSEGLWLLPASSGTNKVLIATGAGSTYTTAGTYIINSSGGIEASFRSNGATIGQVLNGYSRTEIGTDGMRIVQRASGSDTEIAQLGYGSGNAKSGTTYAPYYTFGRRRTTSTAYSSSSTYAVGDLCVYNNELYVCKTAITTAEAWNASHWQLAIGNYSVAEGYNNTAGGYASHAEGWETTAGYASHAEGINTIASGNYSHAEGGGILGDDTSGIIASGYGSHAEGFVAYASGTATIVASGNGSHAEGDTFGTHSILASNYGSHAEGRGTTASGVASHAEGQDTTASNSGSHAEGEDTTASGVASHAEGQDTTSSANSSHAEGLWTVASGDFSHAQNRSTTAQTKSQTALGEYNKLDTAGSTTTRGNYAVIVGNGTADNARSNALTVDWSGNVDIASGAKYKINGTALSASDVGALASSTTYVSGVKGNAESTYRSGQVNITSANIGALPLSGGTMTGQILTSFKASVAMGSYQPTATTVPTLVDEVRYSSGCAGSVSIGTAYTANNVTIATGWYNFMYMPHRSGGVNGSASGDNCNYGNLFLFGMNNTNGRFIVRVSSSAIAEVCKLLTSLDRYTRSSAGTLDWTNTADGDTKVIMKSALAFWNGAYSGTSSTLKYSANGEILGSNTSPSTITVSASSTTTGTLSSSTCRQYGKVVQLTLSVKNTSAVASGSNFYSATLSSSVPAPVAQCTGSSFYAGRAIGGYIDTSRNVIIRNSSGSSVTLGSADTINISFTYITA